MTITPRRALGALAGAALLCGALPAAAAATDALYGVTDQNRIIRFNADSPGNPLSNTLIQGLTPNEVVVGVDVRPVDDHLYVITTENRILQTDPTTGETRPFFNGFLPVGFGAGTSSLGVDFDPVGDDLRLTANTEQNLRVRMTDATTAPEGNLQYAPGDPNAGQDPAVGAIAYTSNVVAAPSTTLVGIDSARDTLVRIDPASEGTMRTIGALGVDAGPFAGFDVAPSGNAYAAFQTAGAGAVNLHRIDLATGRAAAAATDPAIRVPTGAGVVRGIAVAGALPDDKTRPEASVAFSSTILEENTDTLKPSVSCNETCTVAITARVDGVSAGSATETIVGAGRETVEVRLNDRARREIDRRGTEVIRLAIRVTDAAGNVTEQERVSRTQTLGGRRG